MARQQEFSRKDADLVPAPVIRHGSFIAGITSDPSVDLDLNIGGLYLSPTIYRCRDLEVT